MVLFALGTLELILLNPNQSNRLFSLHRRSQQGIQIFDFMYEISPIKLEMRKLGLNWSLNQKIKELWSRRQIFLTVPFKRTISIS
jgi:hypothetical protein